MEKKPRTDSTAPATKQDVAILMEMMGKHQIEYLKRLDGLREEMASKKEIKEWKEELRQDFRAQIQILAGQIRHDLMGVRADEIEQLKDVTTRHDRRIVRLEQHAGLATAA